MNNLACVTFYGMAYRISGPLRLPCAVHSALKIMVDVELNFYTVFDIDMYVYILIRIMLHTLEIKRDWTCSEEFWQSMLLFYVQFGFIVLFFVVDSE